METKDYLRQSVGNILAILSKNKTQLPLLTYGDTTKSVVESIAKILQRAITHSPPFIMTTDPTPTPEHTTPDQKQLPMNVPTIIPTTPTIPV